MTTRGLAIIVSMLVITEFAVFGETESNREQTMGAYDKMTPPSEQDLAALQRLAEADGTDLTGILKRMPEDDIKAWSSVFKLSLSFKAYDRPAQTYGYLLFTSFTYYVSSCGVQKYAKLVDAQPAAIRQRVRDFLFYNAAAADPKVRKLQEDSYRRKMPELFPASYKFGEDDPLFLGFMEH